MITLSDGVTTVELDPDLAWKDEWSWSPVQQETDRSLTGALLVFVGIKTGGRPITLGCADDRSGWMRRAPLNIIRGWEAQLDLAMTLTIRGQVFDVQFRRFDGNPIEADQVRFVANPAPGGFGDWYRPTFRFLTV